MIFFMRFPYGAGLKAPTRCTTRARKGNGFACETSSGQVVRVILCGAEPVQVNQHRTVKGFAVVTHKLKGVIGITEDTAASLTQGHNPLRHPA
jgi:hypothetical protein